MSFPLELMAIIGWLCSNEEPFTRTDMFPLVAGNHPLSDRVPLTFCNVLKACWIASRLIFSKSFLVIGLHHTYWNWFKMFITSKNELNSL
ncbi:hypothetical protein QFZ72_003283 [Bacillus sp. V2I10]|nr:hypothetical protein [Bacillus sp. V2I10]